MTSATAVAVTVARISVSHPSTLLMITDIFSQDTSDLTANNFNTHIVQYIQINNIHE